jgi:hypothetical protein
MLLAQRAKHEITFGPARATRKLNHCAAMISTATESFSLPGRGCNWG